jgi:hypothetical protein
MRLTSGARKLLLTAHVTSSLGWMGAVACYLTLAVAGLVSLQNETVQGVYVAMNLISWFVIVPLGITTPATGIVQALGTPWGLTRRYWVVTKLVVTLPCSIVLLAHMLPTIQLAQAAMHGQVAGDALHDLRVQLVADSAVALVALVFAATLGVVKPKGLTEHGAQLRGEDVASHRPPAWIVWLRRTGWTLVLAFLAAHIAGRGIGGHGMHSHGT